MASTALHDTAVLHHDDHGHDHGHHKETFLTKYIFSQDHKMIAKQFLITGIIMAVVAMILSILFRLQLAWPDKSFPLLETFLGPKWAEGGRIKPDFYLAIVTIHGTMMVFFPYSFTIRCKGYGIAIPEYDFILVVLYCLWDHDGIILCRERTCKFGLDGLSSLVCLT